MRNAFKHASKLSIKSGCVARSHRCITMLRFQSLRALWLTVQAKNIIRNTPASVTLTKSRTEAITHATQIVNYVVREKEMEHKGEQW